MAIHAEAVEILVSKRRFEPQVAICIAEAIEVSVNRKQLVTVPILDAPLQGLKAGLVRWVFLAMLANVALSTGTAAVFNMLPAHSLA
jgi:hypothetical protein